MSTAETRRRVVSGMRPTGRLHLGHYRGVLRNWLALQRDCECFFFVADWHALTTHYGEPGLFDEHVVDMVIDWLAAGVDPGSAALFVQSEIPEHAELHLLLSMITPLGWLERVPSYKDQQESLKEKRLDTYGFLGYPLLQAADILIYRAAFVPVGADQVAHVELTREVARRFNHIYGREPGLEERVGAALRKAGKKAARRLGDLRTAWRERGDQAALERARELLGELRSVAEAERGLLAGWLEGGGRTILAEPASRLTPAAKMPGLDGRKMSKSYGNTIGLREPADEVAGKIRTMPTDPARVRRSDPGDPERCPVWGLHQVYSDEATREWAAKGCATAGIGCLECKRPLTDAVVAELEPIRREARPYEADPGAVRAVLDEGRERARASARATLDDVREAMGLGGR